MRRRPVLAIGVPVIAVLLLLCPLGAVSLPQPLPDRGTTRQPIHLGPGHPSVGAWANGGAARALTHEASALLMCALGAGLIGAAVGAFRTWRDRRAEDAARLRAHLATALQRDRALRGLAVTPRVRLPLLGGAGPHVELHGEVPTLWFRYAVRHAMERETAAVVETYRIVDRMKIRPAREADAMAA